MCQLLQGLLMLQRIAKDYFAGFFYVSLCFDRDTPRVWCQ